MLFFVFCIFRLERGVISVKRKLASSSDIFLGSTWWQARWTRRMINFFFFFFFFLPRNENQPPYLMMCCCCLAVQVFFKWRTWITLYTNWIWLGQILNSLNEKKPSWMISKNLTKILFLVQFEKDLTKSEKLKNAEWAERYNKEMETETITAWQS